MSSTHRDWMISSINYWTDDKGHSDGGGYRYLYPTKSAQVNFLWGKHDVRTAIQQFYTPQKTYTPQNKFLAKPLQMTCNTIAWSNVFTCYIDNVKVILPLLTKINERYAEIPFKLVLSVLYCVQLVMIKQVRNSTNMHKFHAQIEQL